MPHAISYVRFSTPKQALGDSLRRQLDRTREYCAKHDLTLDETISDEGISGYTGQHTKRGALGRFVVAVDAGRIPRGTYLIIEHLDRFSRQNPRIALTMLLNLINAGIRVVTLFNEQVYSDASKTIEHDLIGAILYMSEAHNASARKADLLKHTWEAKRKAMLTGERKTLTQMRPAWIDVKDGKFVPNRKGAATVRRIYELIAAGLSTYAVCQQLNDPKTGFPALTGDKKRKNGTPVGNGWNTARISEIVRSDAPLGWLQPHRREGNVRIPVGEPIKDYYPAVVTQEIANRARYMLGTRTFHGKGSGRKAPTGEAITNLFSGLSKCGMCGEPMYLYGHGYIGSIGRRRRFHHGYLRCSSFKRNKGCTNAASIPYGPFERFIVGVIGGFSIPDTEGQHDEALQELTERLAEAKAEAEKTYEAVTAWMDDKPTPLVQRRLAELEGKHAKLSVEIADLEKQIEAQRGKAPPSDELDALKRMLKGVQSPDKSTRLLVRPRVAAGMRLFVRHFICFPNRGVIAEYDLGGAMCCIRIWLAPDGEYEVYHTDWDWGFRKGKTWLSFIDGKLHRTDRHLKSQGDTEYEIRTTPIDDWQSYCRDYDEAIRSSPKYDRYAVQSRMGDAKCLDISHQTNQRVIATLRCRA